jgi:hypothetical protein
VMSAFALEHPRDAVADWERALLFNPGYFDFEKAERSLYEEAVTEVGTQSAVTVPSLRWCSRNSEHPRVRRAGCRRSLDA